MTQNWEHRVYWWDHRESWHGKRGSDGFRAMLAAMGAAGWELVTVTETAQTGYTCFFKRPLKSVRNDPDKPDPVSEQHPGN